MRKPPGTGTGRRWGKRPKDPFLRMLYRNPRTAGRISAGLTIAMVLFWILVISGMVLAVYFILFGA
ncbi:MAG: hypothetical protein ACMUIG_00720 [Thermoplasmatota archaeon]